MPLTPEDVSSKRFTPVRLREGYDMAEVDQFLDEVEAELGRLIAESEDLRAKLPAAQRKDTGETGAVPVPAAQTPKRVEETGASPVTEESSTAGQGEEVAAGAVAAAADAGDGAQQTIKVATAAEASSAALRLLEHAINNADEVVAEAKTEAEQIVGTARTEAERLESETRGRADSMEAQARTRAQNLDEETQTKRRGLLGDIEKEKTRLDEEVDTLRAFEREYRSRLKSYFAEQLRALDDTGEATDSQRPSDSQTPGEIGAPSTGRLKSILGEKGGRQHDAGSQGGGTAPGGPED